MDVLDSRRIGKEFYKLARRIAQAAPFMSASGCSVVVPEFANVQPTEGGAFVEATIWVPTEAVYDASGRFLAPPQTEPAPRPAGPWDGNGAR